MKTATDINESKRLLSLGIDPETADMCYIAGWYNKPCFVPYSEREYKEQDVPAWSLSALIAILPEYIGVSDFYYGGYTAHPKIEKAYGKWRIGYGDVFGGSDPDFFTACIDLIEQLVEQGYIKTKKELAIGEIGVIDSVKVQCVEGLSCDSCALVDIDTGLAKCCDIHLCASVDRSDHTDVCFKKVDE